jgi:hypothetical protein
MPDLSLRFPPAPTPALYGGGLTKPLPPAILSLDFTKKSYSLNGTAYTDPTLIPGWAYTGGPGTAENNNSTVLSFAQNVPRITTWGLLMEEAATNLLLQSQDVTTANWGKGGNGTASPPTITPAFAAAPDGTLTAQRFQMTLNGGTNLVANYVLIQQGMTRPAETDIISVYLKSNTTQSFKVGFSVNVLNRQRTLLTVTPLWRRFWFSAPSDPTANGGGFSIYLQGTTGTDNACDILFWGGQLEVQQPNQSGPTSYIPTTTAAVTRPKDSHTINTPGLLPGPDVTILTSVVAPAATTNPGGLFHSLNDGNVGNNAIDFSINAPSQGDAAISVYVAAANVLSFTGPNTSVVNGFCIMGFTAHGPNALFTTMGLPPQSSPLYAPPVGVTTQRFGGWGGALNLDGYIETLYVASQAISSHDLQVATTPQKPVCNVLPYACGPTPPVAGSILLVDPGFWSNIPTAYYYQWYLNGIAIPGAGSPTYTVKATDLPGTFQVRCSAGNSFGLAGPFTSSNSLTG